MSEQGWESVPVDGLYARRGAALELARRSLPPAPAPWTLTSAQRLVLPFAPSCSVLDLAWESEAEDDADVGGTLSGFVLLGPKQALILGRTDMGGDDLDLFSEQSTLDQKALLDWLNRNCAQKKDEKARLGFARSWRRLPAMKAADALGQAKFAGRYLAEWHPSALDIGALDDDQRQIAERVLAHAEHDAEAVKTRSKAIYSNRAKRNPWVRTFDKRTLQPDATGFFAAAHAELLGFDAPDEGDPVQLRMNKLPFYRDTMVVDMLDRRAGYPRTSRFLFATGADPADDHRIAPIDWKSETIHRWNSTKSLQLNAENVTHYVDFFARSIAGDSGYFHVVEDADGLSWTGVDSGPRRKAGQLLHPLRLWTKPETDADSGAWEWQFLLSGWVTYARSLFHAVFAVNTAGYVMMLEDTEVCTELPIVPEAVSVKTHRIYPRRPA